MDLVWVVIGSLGLIVLFFLYVFVFRVPSAQINAQTAQKLAELYADDDPTVERSTLLLRSREPRPGELSALVIWLSEYERIDPTRQILPTAFQDYYEGTPERLRFREVWPASDYDKVQQSSAQAFEHKLAELQSEGWQIVFDLSFSRVDHLVYLRRDSALSGNR
jgi:hypothetical protein